MLRLLCTALTLLFAIDARADRCARAEFMFQEAARIRGLAPKSPVQCRELGEREYFEEIAELIRRDLKPQRLAVEERVFKLLGLIPENFPFAECLIESYAHEAAAFYSPVKRSFVMPSWIPAMDLVLIHEATHALQDQYYDLDFLDRSPTVIADRPMAVGAMIEGDAMVVEAGLRARSSDQLPVDVDPQFQVQPAQGCGLPSALEDLFYFEYEFGPHFVQTVNERLPIDRLFERVPTTTREILHPEMYGTVPPPKELGVPAPAALLAAGPRRLLYSERLGEFFIRTLFKQFTSVKESLLAAAGWDGDRLALFREKSSGAEIAVWQVRMISGADAVQFMKTAGDWLSKRFGFSAPDLGVPFVTSTGNGGMVALERSGTTVTVTVRAPRAKLTD